MKMQTEIKAKFQPIVEFHNSGIYRKYIKRILDFVLSLAGIILLSPVLLIIAILVRINLGSPIIFKQERPGLNGKIFTLYKFRTMTDEVDENGELLDDELRLTKFGRLLRSTSLDELPELFNILRGDMSIVGPRPLLTEYLPYYKDEEKLRHSVRPGLTGLAQIKGRNLLEWDKRFALDVEYVKNLNFFMDLKIIIITIYKVLKRSDIVDGQHHIMERLDVERKWMNM
ncbi:MAG: sugar transferase [Caldicoprobacterales bacterium]